MPFGSIRTVQYKFMAPCGYSRTRRISVTSTPPLNEDQELESPRGHTIGFIDSSGECDALTSTLNQAGFPNSAISIWRGDEGVRLLEQMLTGSLWGEVAEVTLKQGRLELQNGHAVVCIAVHDAAEAEMVAAISLRHGGRNVCHFGFFVDTRLTV
jgi:hypothetical protein